MSRIGVAGNGRMGQAIRRLILEAGDEFVGFVGPGDYASLREMGPLDGILDFSYPGNLNGTLAAAKRLNIPAVIGTTGYTEEQTAAIKAASALVPIVYASNFSTGVTVMNRLVREAARALQNFDVEIVETHHRKKVDAPSGTAKTFLKNVDPEGTRQVLDGRSGIIGERGNEIGMHALRGGTVAGEHRVFFFGNKEELEIRHRAEDREIFAAGALQALAFAMKQKDGLYDMEDVLFH